MSLQSELITIRTLVYRSDGVIIITFEGHLERVGTTAQRVHCNVVLIIETVCLFQYTYNRFALLERQRQKGHPTLIRSFALLPDRSSSNFIASVMQNPVLKVCTHLSVLTLSFALSL